MCLGTEMTCLGTRGPFLRDIFSFYTLSLKFWGQRECDLSLEMSLDTSLGTLLGTIVDQPLREGHSHFMISFEEGHI